ncbi:hypothetical protein O9G_000155 [Rozella allomycis CSF55]|uniref:Uncharacterized protein n=1 Tax=Rozella allomycis (strain CSF55) TaxID=988480 RepID=A0A075ASJ1_ROZAC|nr:hypothetical protein O9G_000155 [Rozella allomycis CSF55]|eukprot:EPZ31676.1 hypothetical protein O9G_000155 [Rozella allomycis CSF55]
MVATNAFPIFGKCTASVLGSAVGSSVAFLALGSLVKLTYHKIVARNKNEQRVLKSKRCDSGVQVQDADVDELKDKLNTAKLVEKECKVLKYKKNARVDRQKCLAGRNSFKEHRGTEEIRQSSRFTHGGTLRTTEPSCEA